MRHVFVETNWVIDWCAPAHHRNPAAVELLERARRGELRLHLPAPCLTEARPPLAIRFQPREAKPLRTFLRWAHETGALSLADIEAARRMLDTFERTVQQEIDPSSISARLRALREDPAIDVFALDDAMLKRAVALTDLDLQLKPHDQAILAAVLECAHRLAGESQDDVCFATLDRDLWPWGDGRGALRRICDQARLWVYNGFQLRWPERPESWPAGEAE